MLFTPHPRPINLMMLYPSNKKLDQGAFSTTIAFLSPSVRPQYFSATYFFALYPDVLLQFHKFDTAGLHRYTSYNGTASNKDYVHKKAVITTQLLKRRRNSLLLCVDERQSTAICVHYLIVPLPTHYHKGVPNKGLNLEESLGLHFRPEIKVSMVRIQVMYSNTVIQVVHWERDRACF